MKKIHKLLLIPALAFTSLTFTSCGPYARQGAVTGGLLGAGAGGIIGHQSGRGLEGAAVGGALGALAGGAWGSSHDDDYRYRRGYSQRDYSYRYDNRRHRPYYGW